MDAGQWLLIDEGGGREIISAETLDEAREAAEKWAREGEWGQHDAEASTVYVRVTIYDHMLNRQNSFLVTIDPDEPVCIEGEHDWQSPHEIVGGIKENPGVWGHGGGVTITEVCMHCGCERFRDTWAQDPSSGEQGLKSVRYTPSKYAEEIETFGTREGQ